LGIVLAARVPHWCGMKARILFPFLVAVVSSANAAADTPVIIDPFSVAEQSVTIGDEPQSTVSKIDVYNTPGGAGDVNRALQILPGVNFVDEGNALYIKGGSADETKTYVNDIPFPTSHQSQAPTGTNDTTMATTYTQRVSLYAGNVPVNYGNELSGVVALETLAPSSSQIINLDIGAGGLSGLAQHPLSDGAALDIGTSLNDSALLFKFNPTAFAFSEVPKAAELFLSASFKPTSTTDAQLVGYVKDSESGILVSSPSFTGIFREGVKTAFATERLKGITGNGWEWKAAAGYGSQLRSENLGTLIVADHVQYTALTSDWTKEISRGISLGIGADAIFNHGGVRGTVPTGSSFDPSLPSLPLNFFHTDEQFSGYASMSFRPLPATELSVGERLDAFLGQPGGVLGQPRLSGAWHVNHGTTVHFYAGEMSKAGTTSQLAEAINRLNPARAREESLTVSQKGKGYSLDVSGFLKNYQDLIEYDREYRAVGGNYGRARGVTVGAKAKPLKRVILGVDYTLTHSDRTDADTGLLANSGFDVRNTLALTTQVRLGYSTVSFAYRFATGKPYTPIVAGMPSEVTGVFTPVYGAPESQRLPDFNRFDVTFNRLQLIGNSLWVPYVSVTNLLNHGNIIGYTYSNDYTQKFPQPSYYRRTIYFGVSTSF
jgi:TonB-dependent receptor-like protein